MRRRECRRTRKLRPFRNGISPWSSSSASNTALRVAYVGSFGYHGLLSVDPNSIPAQICSDPGGCAAGGTPGTTQKHCAQGAQYIPVGTRPNPYLSGGFFWYTEGNSSYNALQMDVTRRFSKACNFAPTTPGRRIWI